MKYLIPIFLVFFAVSGHTQIKLEHSYPAATTAANLYFPFGLFEVDSDIWRYVYVNESDSITLYNRDHSLDRVIVLPTLSGYQLRGIQLLLIEKRLFDLDDAYEYMLFVDEGNDYGLRIFKEDGSMLFSCDTCQLNPPDVDFTGRAIPAIKWDGLGTKMIISKAGKIEVYSLPGKLSDWSSTTLGVTNPTVSTHTSLATSAYPNPSNDRVRITYELPSGVSTGQIILLTEDGREVKRFQVTNAFNDLLIEESDLLSGSYFYKLVTDKGESQAKRIVRLK